MHGGGARDDPEGAELRQLRNQRVGDAIRKIFLAGVSGEILQRQDGNRVNRGHTSSKNPTANAGNIENKVAVMSAIARRPGIHVNLRTDTSHRRVPPGAGAGELWGSRTRSTWAMNR